jgi:hypothetical protein
LTFSEPGRDCCDTTCKKFTHFYIETEDGEKILVWEMKEPPKKLRAYRSVLITGKKEYGETVFFDYQVGYSVEDVENNYKERFDGEIEILKIEEYAFIFDPERFAKIAKMDENSPTMQIITSLFERAYESYIPF